MQDTPKDGISTKLYTPQSDAAEKYQAQVLLKENRKITKEEAVNELVRLGAKTSLPERIFNMLFGGVRKNVA